MGETACSVRRTRAVSYLHAVLPCRPRNTPAWCAVVVVAIVMLGKSPRRCMARPLVQGSPVHAPAVQQAHLGPRSQAQWTEPARCPTWHLAGPNAPVPWMGRWPARSSSMLLPHLVGQVPPWKCLAHRATVVRSRVAKLGGCSGVQAGRTGLLARITADKRHGT